MIMSKRHVSNDFSSTAKRRRIGEEDPKTREAEGTIEHDSSGPWNKHAQKQIHYQSTRKRAITTANGGGCEVTTRKKDDSPSGRQRRVHRILPPDIHGELVSDFCPRQESRFTSSFSPLKKTEEYLPGTMSATSRHLGRSLLTTSMLAPPLSLFVGPTERLDHADRIAHNIQESQHSSSLSALTSYDYNLLLDHVVSRQSLEEELALKRHSLNARQRDTLLLPDDMLPLHPMASRLGALLPCLQQDYRAPMIAPTRHCLGPNKRGASWLGASTSTADILEQPQHGTAGPLLAFKENQAKLLQAQLLANDLLLHRSYGFYPTSYVDSLLLETSLNNDAGQGKVPQLYKRQAPKADYPDKQALPVPEHKKSTNSNPDSTTARFLPIPLAEKGKNKKGCCHFSERICVSLATDEDPNWLSEFLCFVRSDIVEVFRANHEDVKCRNNTKKVNHGQVGIRCRYCAHMPSTSRTRRSSSFPFTLSRIYQSLTMMLRDHFGNCPCIPKPIHDKYLLLKGKTPQGASGSNQYWESSARKLGLIDSPLGIWVKERSDSQGKHGDSSDNKHDETVQSSHPKSKDLTSSSAFAHSGESPSLLVKPNDHSQISEFLYELMTHIQLVQLDESERLGNRKNLQVGMPGLGCRHCCQNDRKGLCRTFPARRRTLSQKLLDLYEHIRRCSLCPKEQRERLIALNKSHEDIRSKKEPTTKAGETAFLDRLWERMATTRNKAPIDSL